MPCKKVKKFPSLIEERTIELYAQLPRNIRDVEIAKETGLTSVWLSAFVSGRSRFADAGRIQALYDYCAAKCGKPTIEMLLGNK